MEADWWRMIVESIMYFVDCCCYSILMYRFLFVRTLIGPIVKVVSVLFSPPPGSCFDISHELYCLDLVWAKDGEDKTLMKLNALVDSYLFFWHLHCSLLPSFFHQDRLIQPSPSSFWPRGVISFQMPVFYLPSDQSKWVSYFRCCSLVVGRVVSGSSWFDIC